MSYRSIQALVSYYAGRTAARNLALAADLRARARALPRLSVALTDDVATLEHLAARADLDTHDGPPHVRRAFLLGVSAERRGAPATEGSPLNDTIVRR